MNYFDYIDDYLQNRLDESMRTEFERALETDASLKEELDFLRSMRDGFSEEETYALKSRIKNEVVNSDISTKVPSGTKARSPFLKYWWILLPFFVLLGYFVGKSIKKEPVAPKALYAQYHQPKVRIGGVRNTDQQKPMDVILNEMYQAADYKGLYGRITDLPPTEVTHDYLFALGLACVELDRHKEAIEIFDQFISNANPMYKDQALWSKAMVYLKTEDLANAREILRGIAEEGKKDSAKAKEILDALK